jgi:DNA polymerase-3 subunit epsilon
MPDARARREAILRALAELARKPVYLDTETTGLEDADEIVEICILDVDGRVVLDSLVKPKGGISAEAGKVHGITQDTVRDAPTWLEVWPGVEATLAGQRVEIYNADFDVRMMRQSHMKYGLPWPTQAVNFACIMKLYAQFHGEWNYRTGSYRWHSLEVAGQQCHLPLPNTHRAKEDALLARAVLHYMAESKH